MRLLRFGAAGERAIDRFGSVGCEDHCTRTETRLEALIVESEGLDVGAAE